MHKLEEEGGRDLYTKRYRLKHHLVPFFGDTPLSKSHTSEVDRYKKERLEQVALPGGEKQRPNDETKLKATSKGTINRELSVLSHLFNKAIDWGWITARPAKICRFQEGQGRITYLTVEQIQRLIESAKQDQNQARPCVLWLVSQ